jgi:small redox-active disulfide protein 2
MEIEVVGTGCATCQHLHDMANNIANEIGDDAHVEYVTNQDGMKRLLELGLMQSPALVVDGKVILVGHPPSEKELKKLILIGK